MDTTKVKASPDTISCVFNNKPPPAGDLKEIVPVVITVVTLTLMMYRINISVKEEQDLQVLLREPACPVHLCHVLLTLSAILSGPAHFFVLILSGSLYKRSSLISKIYIQCIIISQ